ncbi:MAG: hypothetical protein JSS20_18205, partial [Proteobacteria bacterium]|nr:hypothetical protein [Pseudomonadota bacterium]
IQSLGGDTHSHRRDVSERIGEVVRLIEARHGESSKLSGDVAERLISIENYLASEPDNRSGDGSAVVKEFAERLGGLERAVRAGFGDAAGTSGQMAERLVALERHLAERGRGDDGEGLLMLDERLVGLERQLEARAQQSTALVTRVLERVQALEQRPTASGGGGEAANQLMAASNEKIVSLQSGLGDIVNRLAALDERVKAEAVVTEEALRGRDQDFDFIYNEIRQLGQSQATLNSAVNDWRSESQEHFGTLATRLDKVLGSGTTEAVAAAADVQRTTPIELPNVLQAPAAAEMRPINGANAKSAGSTLSDKTAASLGADDYVLPEQPGHGFWYWLFGTSSVLRANKNSAIQVDRMRRNIREARDRKRGGL